MKENKDYKKIIADRILTLCDVANYSVEHMAELVEIPEERLKEITECKGEDMSVGELIKFRENLLISPDYILGIDEFMFAFEPTDENIYAFGFSIMERLKELEDNS